MAGTDIIQEYFIRPIVERTGYNILNTLTYGAVALVALYTMFKLLRNAGIKINRNFFAAVLAFALFGTSMRVVSDAKDSGILPVGGAYELIRNSGSYGYGFLTVSPGIYIVVAIAFLAAVFVSNKIFKNERLAVWAGLILAVPHLLLLVPIAKFAGLALIAIVMAIVPLLIAYRYATEKEYAAAVGAQALDGAATFIAMDMAMGSGLNYNPIGVVTKSFGDLASSYLPFYLMKTGIAGVAIYMLQKDNEFDAEEKLYVVMIITVMGLAPGLHDLLRIAVGA